MPLLRVPRIYDGTGGPPLADHALRLDDVGRITQVGPADALTRAGDEVLELEGVLTPGLIDCHVHLCLSGGPDPRGELLATDPERLRVQAEEGLRAHLEAGVTTIRDLGGVEGIAIALGREVEAGTLPGPEVLAAGRLVCALGGHGVFLGREADGPDAVASAVHEEIMAGARCVKVVATGGMMTPGVEPGAQQLSEAAMAAAVAVAHEYGLRVAAHAQGTGGILAALAAGVHTIEHGIWLTEEAVARLVETGAHLVPTFNAARGILAGKGRGVPDFVIEKMIPAKGAHEDSFRRALAAGAHIAAGTDAGTPLNPHGSLATELKAMIELGMPGVDALHAATGAAADALGLPDHGRLVPGRQGDFVLFDDDPVEDASVFAHPRRVWRRGREVVSR